MVKEEGFVGKYGSPLVLLSVGANLSRRWLWFYRQLGHKRRRVEGRQFSSRATMYPWLNVVVGGKFQLILVPKMKSLWVGLALREGFGGWRKVTNEVDGQPCSVGQREH